MARRRPGLKESAGLGAAGGLLLALWLTSEGVAVGALPCVAGGVALGALHNFWRYGDDRTCRIWWIFGGCGGQSTIYDTDGHSRPRRPCWGHRSGKPRRLVNLVLVPVQIALVVVVVVVVAVSVAAVAP